ncbi:MAG: exodeoxyribonuclease VII small subunit [Desulfuromonadales bacterium]|jgi:exodeoxyribonuclease VII small subunit|nr:exodeoxyribonuclease VII small subunit [Desulfuromonadales bacterium]
MPKEMTFEQALKSLEEAVARLEKGQIPLDEALDCFEAGVQSANACRKKLQAVEARIEALVKSSDGSFTTEPFGDNQAQD